VGSGLGISFDQTLWKKAVTIKTQVIFNQRFIFNHPRLPDVYHKHILAVKKKVNLLLILEKLNQGSLHPKYFCRFSKEYPIRQKLCAVESVIQVLLTTF
jgi:hypothetical protein